MFNVQLYRTEKALQMWSSHLALAVHWPRVSESLKKKKIQI